MEMKMLGKFVKNILGITAAEEEAARRAEADILAEKRRKKEEAAAKRKAAKNKETALAKLSPKDIATKKKERWVDVVSFKLNPEDIKNGFYELDWNEYFIVELKEAGYGFDGDPDEEIVGRWFRDICINAAAVDGIDMTDRSTGVVDVPKVLKKNRTRK